MREPTVRTATRRAIGAVALVLLPAAALVSACGPSSTPSAHASAVASATPSPPSGPMLAGTIIVQEADNLHANFTVPAQVPDGSSTTPAPVHTSCTQYAAGNHNGFAPPVLDATMGNYKVYFNAAMPTGYHGPGVYQSSNAHTLQGTIAVDVGVATGQSGAVSVYRSRIGGSSVMTVRGDGSGTFEYTEWGSDEVRGDTGSAASVAGTVSWTCR